jgi:hypothetical protein
LTGRPIGVGVSFPGPENRLIAPNGAREVVNEDGVDNHVLHLVEKKGGASKAIYPYSRSVQVAWSHDSRRLLITDHRGSDEASCIVFDVSSAEGIDLLERFRRQPAEHPWLGNHHVYLSCASWLDEASVLVKAEGYGDRDPDGFSRRYRIDAKGSIEEVQGP